MEPGPSPGHGKDGYRKASLHSYTASRATPNAIAFHRYMCKDANTSGESTHEDRLDVSQNGDTHSRSDTVRNHSTVHTARLSHESELPYIPLTAQVLFEHNLQQANMSRLPKFRHVAPQGQVNMLEAAVNPADNRIHSLHRESIGAFESKSLYTDAPSQTLGQRQSIASMCNEADGDTYTHQSIRHWQSRRFNEDNVVDMPELDTCDVDPLSWDIGEGQELTAWDNALAGVGEHLADHTYQEYTNHDELVVD